MGLFDQIENSSVSETPWYLSGEITGTMRPINSALGIGTKLVCGRKSISDFSEKSKDLENIIKKRILEKRFDDYSLATNIHQDLVINNKGKENLNHVYSPQYSTTTQIINNKSPLNSNEITDITNSSKIRKAVKIVFKELILRLNILCYVK